MSHNTIGLLKANGQIEEYGNTSGGGSDTSFVGTTAEWNALTTEQKALYEIVNFTDDSTAPEVVDSVPTQNSTNLVQSGGVWTKTNRIDQNFGTVELSSTAAYAHAVGETFINAAGQMVKCIAAIAVGDTIIIGSNVAVTNLASLLNNKLTRHYVGGRNTTFKSLLNETGTMGIGSVVDNISSGISGRTNGEVFSLGLGSSAYQGIIFKHSNDYYTIFICGYGTYGQIYTFTVNIDYKNIFMILNS